MITLTAQIRIQGKNPLPFTLGVSELGGGALFGKTVDLEVVFDKRNILSLESSINERGNVELPSWGLISSGGSASFNDKNSKFFVYANAGLLSNGIEIKIFSENTIKKEKKQLGVYYTTNWDYDVKNKTCSVNFNDGLENFQKIMVVPKNFSKPSNAKNLLQETLSIFSPSTKTVFDNEADHSLYYTNVNYQLIEGETSLWNYISQICGICGIYGYKNNEGSLKFSSEFSGRKSYA